MTPSRQHLGNGERAGGGMEDFDGLTSMVV
jgi:hypothetical protein